MEHNRRTDNILNNNNNWGTRPFAVAQKDCLSGSFVFPSQEGFPILVTGHTKDEDLILAEKSKRKLYVKELPQQRISKLCGLGRVYLLCWILYPTIRNFELRMVLR